MVEEAHFFIFILNADLLVFGTIVFVIAFVALKLIYRMWRSSLRCPHCGETYRVRSAYPPPSPPQTNKTQAQSLWT